MPKIPEGYASIQERLDKVKAMLVARTDRKGVPKKGYQENVRLLIDEIEDLEDALPVAPKPDTQIRNLAEGFLKFDHDGDGEPGGSLPKTPRRKPPKRRERTKA